VSVLLVTLGHASSRVSSAGKCEVPLIVAVKFLNSKSNANTVPSAILDEKTELAKKIGTSVTTCVTTVRKKNLRM
jgi:ribosomal protein L7Ae-like RNA K-turn-binding protein